MGECVYYLKARFPKGVLNKLTPIKGLFREGLKASHWWQDNRGREDHKQFWIDFSKEFPQVTDYLKTCTDCWGDNINKLSGVLDFANGETDIDRMSCSPTPMGDEFYYESMVWHMSSWQPIADYLVKKFGASRAVWDSEEGGGRPELEDYENIVMKILEQRKTLPCLMGIHNDLDELIEIAMRQK